MNRKYLFALLALPLFHAPESYSRPHQAATGAGPAATDTLRLTSLDQTFALLVSNSLSGAINDQQIRQARYNLKAAKGYLYPSVTGTFSGQDNLHLAITPVPGELVGQPGTTFNAQFGKKYNYDAGLIATEDLLNWQNFLQISIEKQNVLLSEATKEANLQNLKTQAAKYYFTALIARKALVIEAADLSLADSLVKSAGLKLSSGSADRIALNQAQINARTIESNMAGSRQLYEYGTENLKILLNPGAGSVIEITADINQDNVIPLSEPAMLPDKGLATYQHQVTLADLRSRSQRAAAYPKLSVSMYYGSQQYRNDFGLSFRPGFWQPYRYIGLNLSVPLFTGLTNTSRYKSTLTQKTITVLEQQNARLQSAVNDELLYKDLRNYAAAAAAANASFRLYGENLRLNRQKFQEGLISGEVYQRYFQDYLNAENTYLNNISQYLNTKSAALARQ
jgi:outer membrane protein TolC